MLPNWNDEVIAQALRDLEEERRQRQILYEQSLAYHWKEFVFTLRNVCMSIFESFAKRPLIRLLKFLTALLRGEKEKNNDDE